MRTHERARCEPDACDSREDDVGRTFFRAKTWTENGHGAKSDHTLTARRGLDGRGKHARLAALGLRHIIGARGLLTRWGHVLYCCYGVVAGSGNPWTGRGAWRREKGGKQQPRPVATSGGSTASA